MTIHKFVPIIDPDTSIVFAVSNAKRCKVIYSNYRAWKPNTYVPRKVYNSFANDPFFKHEILTESEYLLDQI